MKRAKTMLAIMAITAVTSLQMVYAVPMFELVNKSDQSIQYILADLSKNHICRDTVPGGTTSRPLEQLVENGKILDPVLLSIRVSGSKDFSRIFELNGKNVTKYVTWNPAKSPNLYPQTGPMMGWKGVTESGLPLTNNIKASDIKERE